MIYQLENKLLYLLCKVMSGLELWLCGLKFYFVTLICYIRGYVHVLGIAISIKLPCNVLWRTTENELDTWAPVSHIGDTD